MPRNVVTAWQLCKEGKFAKKISRFANLDFDVSPSITATWIVELAKFAKSVCIGGGGMPL
jgi:hypothetical protein